MKCKIVWQKLSPEEGKKFRDFLEECEKSGRKFFSDKNRIGITKIINSVELENTDLNALNFLLERLIKSKLNPPMPIRSVKLIGTKKEIEEVINFASERNVVDY